MGHVQTSFLGAWVVAALGVALTELSLEGVAAFFEQPTAASAKIAENVPVAKRIFGFITFLPKKVDH
jgi:hypothetical protein